MEVGKLEDEKSEIVGEGGQEPSVDSTAGDARPSRGKFPLRGESRLELFAEDGAYVLALSTASKVAIE